MFNSLSPISVVQGWDLRIRIFNKNQTIPGETVTSPVEWEGQGRGINCSQTALVVVELGAQQGADTKTQINAMQ